MNTFILTCSCDTLISNVCAKLCTCGTEIIKPGTNSADVSIAGTICTSLVAVVLIGVSGFLVWKLLDYIAKGISGHYKRGCEVKDKMIKQRSDLLDKYLDFLKDQTKNIDVSIAEFENQRNGIVDILLELIQNDKIVCLNPDPAAAKTNNYNNDVNQNKSVNLNNGNEGKDCNQKPDEKGKQSKEKSQKDDNVISPNEIRKESICDLIKKLRSYTKLGEKEMVVDKSRINQYRQVLEYMIELSQKDKLNEFSETKLNTIFNTPKDEE